MLRKFLFLALLASIAAVSTQVLSQGPSLTNPAATTNTAPSNTAPKIPSSLPPAGEKSAPPTSFSPPSSSSATSSSPSFESLPAQSEPAKSAAKDAPAGKADKTFPTSSQTSSSASSSSSVRKELFIERGFVTLINDNKVPAAEPGMITALPFEEGASVEREDLVAEIDTRSTRARMRIAEGERNAANAQASNEAELDVAMKAEEVAKASLAQIDEIIKKNPLAISEFERRKTYFEHEKAKAQIKQATNEREIARLTATAKQAQLDAAMIELDLRQARAPFKGQIVEIMKKPGDWVTVGEPIMPIIGLDKLRVKGYVQVAGEHGASHEEVIGKPVTITIYAAGDKKHTVKGIIGFASPEIEGFGNDRQFRIWADVDNEKSIDPVTKQESWKIQPGSMASMTIDLAPPKPAPVTKSESTKALKPVTDGKGAKTGSRER